MKRKFLILAGVAALILSANSSAAILTFAFHVPLDVANCFGFDNCETPPTEGVIYLELSIDDPYLSGQQWGDLHVVSYAVSGFPAHDPWASTSSETHFTGSYTVDPSASAATAVLDSYSITNIVDPDHIFTRITDRRWTFRYNFSSSVDVRYITAEASPPVLAIAQLTPVPVPAAAYLLISALVGLFGTKRMAYKRQFATTIGG